MTDNSKPPFMLPDSVLRRRRGLLEGAMPQPLPHQWAEHLELLTADGKLTSVNDMLALMQKELDRLQEQIDSDDEPDRHSETVLAAATAGMLSEKAEQVQRKSRREVYFALLLGYLYGRLTKPGSKSMSEDAEAHIRVLQAQLPRKKGGRKTAEQRKTAAKERMAEAEQKWDRLAARGVPERERSSIIAREMGVQPKTVREWRTKDWGK